MLIGIHGYTSSLFTADKTTNEDLRRLYSVGTIHFGADAVTEYNLLRRQHTRGLVDAAQMAAVGASTITDFIAGYGSIDAWAHVVHGPPSPFVVGDPNECIAAVMQHIHNVIFAPRLEHMGVPRC